MFGAYRFFLAIVVLASHAGIYFFGFNSGVAAVVSFFLLSGYVVTGVCQRSYPGIGIGFFGDRCIRVYPQYFFICLLTLVLWHIFPLKNTLLATHMATYSTSAVIYNFLLIPINYFHFNSTKAFLIVPTAWSLGLEMCFYIALPFLLMKKDLREIFFYLSFGCFSIAAFGFISTEIYGYRLLPGTLFLFLSGSLMYDNRDVFLKKNIPIIITLVSLLGVGLILKQVIRMPFNREILIGYAFSLVALHFLSRLPRQKWDEMLGAWSYGIFLSHILVLWGVDALGGIDRFGAPGRLLLTFVGSLILSLIGYYLIESPTRPLQLKWRKRFEKAEQKKMA